MKPNKNQGEIVSVPINFEKMIQKAQKPLKNWIAFLVTALIATIMFCLIKTFTISTKIMDYDNQLSQIRIDIADHHRLIEAYGTFEFELDQKMRCILTKLNFQIVHTLNGPKAMTKAEFLKWSDKKDKEEKLHYISSYPLTIEP